MSYSKFHLLMPLIKVGFDLTCFRIRSKSTIIATDGYRYIGEVDDNPPPFHHHQRYLCNDKGSGDAYVTVTMMIWWYNGNATFL